MSDRGEAISVRGLSVLMAGRAVLREIDLDVRAGESVALTGANGAGKTTLLRCLAAIRRPSRGEVRWFGRPAGRDPASRGLIGLAAHESLLYPQLTLHENLRFAARMHGLAHPSLVAHEALARLGLAASADRSPATVSKGMRQRVSLARALLHDPPIVLLDEPFAGLDAEGAGWLTDLLLDLRRRGRTICFVVHEEATVRRCSDRVVAIRAGRLEEGVADRPSRDGTAVPRAA